MTDATQTWTAERMALAPDPGSAKAGRELGALRKWQSLGRTDSALWGEHQGSGSKPYRTSIDLSEPAFKCSCPSRKFPCKHGLGLFLTYSDAPGAFSQAQPPAWVSEWLASRSEKVERAAKRETKKAEVSDDPQARVKAEKAQARKAVQRKTRVDTGVEELDRWLRDIVRAGFSAPNLAKPAFWESQAARLVDAQAPGLARMVRLMGQHATSAGDNSRRYERLLEEAARLHLLIEAYRRIDTLPGPLQDEVRTIVGWTQDQAELVKASPDSPDTLRIRGKWFVVNQETTEEDKLRVQRTWLWNVEQPRAALILDFAFGNNALDKTLVPDTQVDGELVYFSGAYPLRALVSERFSPPTTPDGVAAWSIPDGISAYADALALNPMLDHFPMLLWNVVPIYSSEHQRITHLRNPEGDCLPVTPKLDPHLAAAYLALSGGHPVLVFGSWNGKQFTITKVWANQAVSSSAPQPEGDDTLEAGLVYPTVWEALMNSAILGTERRPPEIPVTGEALDTVLGALRSGDAIEKEQTLLSAAATLDLYRRIGQLPGHSAQPLPTPCPAETLAQCSPRATGYLLAILANQYSPAFSEWLDYAAARGKHAPHRTLPSLLDIGQTQSRFREGVLRVIGNRGRWLARLYEGQKQWAYVRDAASLEGNAEEPNMEVWETGSQDARLALLREIRSTRPDRAHAMLASVWKEENANTRASLLSTLRVNLSPADEPFLEAGLDDKSKQVNALAAELLAELPNSALIRRITDASATFVHFSKVKQSRFLGFGSSEVSTIEVTLPQEYTAAMKRDGIQEKPTAKIGERAYWLKQMLEVVPPGVWSRLWGVEPAQILAAALKNEEWKKLLVETWVDAAVRHKDAVWAHALLNVPKRPQDPLYHTPKLVEALSPQQREEYVVQTLRRRPEALYTNDMPLETLWSLPKPWSNELAQTVVQAVNFHLGRNEWSHGGWQISQSISNLAYYIPPSFLQRNTPILIASGNKHTAFDAAVEEFHTTLQFRHDMLKALDDS